jgi:ubiquinone/menaquinone biosynthesis C-methylase UbiE
MMAADIDNARARIKYSGYSHPGFAARYDAAVPPMPIRVVEILTQMAQIERPNLVVDLGSGTGLSTRPWGAYAGAVIGLEPNPQMRQQAETHPDTPPNVAYRDGFSHATGLAAACADIVTCSQSLHWMEPEPTFAEIARILRAGGVFAAYNHGQIPTVLHWQIDAALQEFDQCARQIRGPTAHPTPEHAKQRWDGSGHLRRMKESGHFRYVTELSFHQQGLGDVDWLLRYCRSIAGVNRLLMAGSAEIETALEDLQKAARQEIGHQPLPWLFSYQMWLGVR